MVDLRVETTYHTYTYVIRGVRHTYMHKLYFLGKEKTISVKKKYNDAKERDRIKTMGCYLT